MCYYTGMSTTIDTEHIIDIERKIIAAINSRDDEAAAFLQAMLDDMLSELQEPPFDSADWWRDG